MRLRIRAAFVLSSILASILAVIPGGCEPSAPPAGPVAEAVSPAPGPAADTTGQAAPSEPAAVAPDGAARETGSAAALTATGPATAPGAAAAAAPAAPAPPERPLVRFDGERSAAWKDYEKLVDEQKFEEASRWLEQHLAKVRDAKQPEEWTRTLIEWTKLRMALHGYETAVRFLKEQEWPQDLLSHVILNYYYAYSLLQYASMYSWEINQRERVDTLDEVDLKRWTMEQIHAAALLAQLEVWSYREALGELPVSALSEHIEPNNYPEGIRSTLRDAGTYLLVEQLLNSQGWRPEHSNEVFRLKLETLLTDPLPAGTASGAFLADPEAHPLAKAAVALDDLERWHAGRGNVQAALEARLVRIQGLSGHFSEAEDKAALRDHLRERLAKVRDTDWWAVGMALLAELTRAEDAPDALVRARAIAVECAEAKPGTIGGQRCEHIRASIERPSYELQSMRVDGPAERSLNVDHANLPKLYFRAWPVDLIAHIGRSDDYDLLPNSQETTALMKRSPAARWEVALPETPDYRTHRTYVVPPLDEPGLWVIAASAREDFSRADNQIMAVPMVVSDLVLFSRQRGGVFEGQVRSGSSGAAVGGAEVLLYQYDWQNKHHVVARTRSGADGTWQFRGVGRSQPHFVVARKGDQVTIDPQYLYAYEHGTSGVRQATLLFTDRSIYRPTQTLHWKAVVYRGDADEADFRTQPKASVTVNLMDPNGEVVASKTVTTNDFGTASGEFAVPTGRLLGQWSLRAAPDGYAAVRVEEYKRPTFEAKLLESEAPLRLNQPATLKGEGRYYFGLPVTDAAVKWRVTRTPVYPWWWWWYGGPSAREQVIATGTAAVGEDGTFRFTFTPEADPRTEKQPGVTFRYGVTAEVVDEGGETRTASRSFRLGFVTVEAHVGSDRGFFRAGAPGSLTIRRTDLDGTPAPGTGTWRVVRLDGPDRTLLPADQPLPPPAPGTSAEKAYRTEGDRLRPRWEPGYSAGEVLRLWPDGAEAGTGTAQHGEKGVAEVTLPTLAPGAWRLRYATKDPFGATYETFHDFVVAGAQPDLPLPAYLAVEQSAVPVGGTARVLVHSGLPDQPIVFEIHRAGKVAERRELVSGKDGALIELPVTDRDRGGFGVVAHVLRDHQYVQLTSSVFVPWDDKELKVAFSTFRDLLRPGQTETWTVKVTGPAGRDAAVAAAEVLAYMYDRSLDVFAPHNPPSLLGLFPSRTGTAWMRSNLGQAQHIWVDSSGFRGLPGYPSLVPDRLEFEEGWGIGGPGRRGYYRGGVGAGGGGLMLRRSRMMVPATGAPAPAAPAEPDAAEEAMAEAPAAQAAVVDAVPAGDTRAEAKDEAGAAPAVELRADFSETAFWQPHLVTDADGTASIVFEVPDSVTSWNVWVHALTRDFLSGNLHTETRTVKELMVRPYLPRFLREGDRASLKVVVNNASDREIAGELVFDIIDPATEQSVLAEFGLKPQDVKQPFTVPAGGGTNLTFPVVAPARIGTVAFRVVATAGDFSDGELRPIPLLPGRIHLAQSRFVTLRDAQRREMHFADLARDDDPTLINEQMVVTIDGQLFYQVLSALPYLVNYPYECTEQTLNRFLSAGIMTSLFDRYPAVRAMAQKLAARETRYETFDAPDPNRKMALEETPWLVEARGGEEKPDELVNVLDPRIAKANRVSALAKLRKAQTSSGGWPWFPGGPPSPYMTLYILYGFSKGLEFGVEAPRAEIERAWAYLHRHYVDEVVQDMMAHDCCWEFITFLNYTLSNYPDTSWTGGVFSADERQTMLDFSFRHWKEHSPYTKGYLALTLQRMDRAKDARLVWESVMDSAKTEPDQGTFWAPEDRAWLWYNDTIETHAFAVRTVMEITPESEKLDGLVLWLFLNKKMNHWKSTKATAEVVYSLAHYLQKTASLAVREEALVSVGPVQKTFVFEPDEYTGKKNQVVIPGESIDPKTSSTVVVEKETKGLMFASATWHFSTERLPAEERGDFLGVSRTYFKRVKEGREVTLVPLKDGTPLVPGDEVEVHLSLRSKHPVDYVHLRDPRGAGFEPVDTTSKHKWDLGIYWYEEIRDSGTNFFFEHLPQGEYAFKYRIRAATAGTFKVSPATVQPMYSPEFTAYSAGHTLTVQ